MKIPNLPILCLAASAVLTVSLNAEDGGKEKLVFRVAATHDSLSQKLRMQNAVDPMKALEKSEGVDPSTVNQPVSLLDSSDLISYGGITTIVPKRAIMQIPEKYKDRINSHVDGNTIVGWLDFYAKNRGWITTVEISRAQAAGREGFSEEFSEQLSKNTNLVITVLAAGPISFRPYVAEENEGGKTE